MKALHWSALWKVVFCFAAITQLGRGLIPEVSARPGSPTSKLYVAELEGVADIDTGDRVVQLTKGNVYSAADSIIRTMVGSSNAIVFSNGTGVHLDPETFLKIEQFVQEPFLPNRTDLDVEPSVSRMILVLSQGRAGLCMSRLVAGSSMELKTPHASVQIRGRRVVVETDERKTIVSLIEGDVTVRAGSQDGGGRTLTAWKRATVVPVLATDSYEMVVEDIPEQERKAIEDKAALACMARQTVFFDSAESEESGTSRSRGGNSVFSPNEDDPIRPVPVVPTIPDVPTFVSPAEIARPGGSDEED